VPFAGAKLPAKKQSQRPSGVPSGAHAQVALPTKLFVLGHVVVGRIGHGKVVGLGKPVAPDLGS